MKAAVDPNKVDGGHVAQPSKPTPDAAGHKAIAHRQHTSARQVARAQAHPKPVHPRQTKQTVAQTPVSHAHSRVHIAHKPVTRARIAQTPTPPTRTHTRTHDRTTEQTEIASGNTGSAPHRASSFHRFLGRFLNPDRNTDNRAASYSARQSTDFGPYMAYLHRVLERAWHAPDGHGLRVVVVGFKIHRGGEVTGLRLARSSGNSSFDRSAIDAVRSAAPFRSLPAGAPADVDIEYTFDFHEYHR